MKKLFLAILLTTLINTNAQDLNQKYKNVVSIFIKAVQDNNIEKLKTLVSYPLKREYPLPDITNEFEFVKQFDILFDANLIKIINNSNVNTDWDAVGWKGIIFNNGDLWLDYEGKLITLNYQSHAEQLRLQELIEIDKKSIHKSLRNFKKPILILETTKYRIRIDKLYNGNYRYTSWPIDTASNIKPDLTLTNGKWVPTGTGGNHSYAFSNGAYKYECFIKIIGSLETPPALLIVTNNDKQILRQEAKRIIN